MKPRLRQLEQKALKAMMDPHFIFNVINSIQHFINAGDKEKANLYLADFAGLIRMCNSFSGKSVVSLAEEIAYLNFYLSFEKLRFGENLNYEISVDSIIDLQSAFIPVMMIQPFLHNAIWHGILPNNLAGFVELKIMYGSDDLIKINVSDNGIGIDEKYIGRNRLEHPMQSHESSLTIQRLKLLAQPTGQNLYLQYNHRYPHQRNKGTIVEFLLPVMGKL